MNGFNFQNETFDNMLTKTSQDFTKQQNCDTQSNFTVAKNSYQTARQNFKLMQNPAEGINYGYKAEEVLLMKKRVDKFALNDIYKISAHIYTSQINIYLENQGREYGLIYNKYRLSNLNTLLISTNFNYRLNHKFLK